MKKLSILLVLVMLCGILAMPVFAAQSATFTLTASKNSLYAGDTFTVTISTSAVKDCFSGGYRFDYNKDVFEYVSGSALVQNSDLAGVDTQNDQLAGYFMYMKGSEVEGAIFEVTFKVKDSASLGSYTISGDSYVSVLNNGTSEKISSTANDVTVTVAEKPTCQHSWSDATCTEAATCKLCGEVGAAALGHDMKETAAAVAPTCTVAGKTAVSTCANGCGKTEGGETIPATGHQLVDGVCSICGQGASLLGDANGDGKINLRDAIMVLQAVNGKDIAIDRTAADVTGDGKVNLADAIRILKRANGNKDPFPAEK